MSQPNASLPASLFASVDLAFEELERASRLARILAELFEPRQVSLSFREEQEARPQFVVTGVRLGRETKPSALRLDQDPALGSWSVEVLGRDGRPPLQGWDLLGLLREVGLSFTPAQEEHFRSRVEEILDQSEAALT